MMLHRFLGKAWAAVLLCRCLTLQAADDPQTRLLRQPAVSKDHLAFVYAGDIWISDRDGGHPVQLTSHPASEYAPHFSPDGQWIAFSANYDNNTDVYVMPISGGQPRRLTWHPAADVVTGWTPDGKSVLFVSNREIANSRSSQFYEVTVEGGYEKKVMKAVGLEGAWSPDGQRLAYRPYLKAYCGFERLAPTSRRRYPADLDHRSRGQGSGENSRMSMRRTATRCGSAITSRSFRIATKDPRIFFSMIRPAAKCASSRTNRRGTCAAPTPTAIPSFTRRAAFSNRSISASGGDPHSIPMRLARCKPTQARPQWKDAARITSPPRGCRPAASAC